MIQYTCPKCGAIGANPSDMQPLCHVCDFKVFMLPSHNGKIIRPRIVCLCGSTRFHKEFVEQNYKETMKGNIILSVGFFMHSGEAHGEHIGITPDQKEGLDELHKRKIDLADEIFVLNKDGYIGSSTRSEIDYAIKHGKPVRYLELIVKSKATDYEYPENIQE